MEAENQTQRATETHPHKIASNKVHSAIKRRRTHDAGTFIGSKQTECLAEKQTDNQCDGKTALQSLRLKLRNPFALENGKYL